MKIKNIHILLIPHEKLCVFRNVKKIRIMVQNSILIVDHWLRECRCAAREIVVTASFARGRQWQRAARLEVGTRCTFVEPK